MSLDGIPAIRGREGLSIPSTPLHIPLMDRVSGILLTLVMLSIPFNGIRGLPHLRELSVEAAVYPIIAFIIISFLRPQPSSSIYTASIILFGSVLFLAINYFLTYSHISTARLGDISGHQKFINGSLVFIFYILFFVSLYLMLSRITLWKINRFIIVSVQPVVIFLTLIWTVEIISWYFDSLRTFIEPIKRYISIGPYFAKFRLSGVSYEPSFNAIVMIGLLPALLLVAASTINHRSVRIRFLVYICIWIIYASLSGSRTAYLIFVLMLILFCFFLALRTSRSKGTFIRYICAPAVILLPPAVLYFVGSDISSLLSRTDNVSDITRLTAINAAITIWTESPLLGVGFGNFGFYYRDTITLISTASWEVREFFGENRWDMFPPSYSLHWRVLCETGLLGFSVIYGFIWGLFRRLGRSSAQCSSEPDLSLLVGTVSVGLAGAVLIGVSFDSYRSPFLWIYGAAALALPKILLQTTNQRSPPFA